MLHEKECKVPARNAWPPGVSLPPTAARLQEAKASPPKDANSLESAIPTPKKSAQDKEPEEVRTSLTCLQHARLTVYVSDHPCVRFTPVRSARRAHIAASRLSHSRI